MSDIFEAIPALQALADSFTPPDEDENGAETPANEGAENAEEADNDAVSEGDESEAGREGGDNPVQEQSAFDAAYQAALAEQQRVAAHIGRTAALQQLQSQAPQLVHFDDLDEATQNQVAAEAQMAGVDPQTVLFTRYTLERQRHEAQIEQLGEHLQSSQQEAFGRVARFVQDNEHVKALPAEERKAFIASIGQLEAVRDLENLAWVDPHGWARSVCRIAGERIAALGAKSVVKNDNDKQTKAMKQSVSSGKAASASKVQTPTEGAKRFVLEVAQSHQSWDKRLKQK